MPPTTKATVRGKFHPKHDPVKMRNEVDRLMTFKTWSKTWPIQPEELVGAGFYYVGILDRVKCFSCGTQIEGWEDGDSAIGEHKKSNPKCDVVKGTDKMNVTVERWINENRQQVKSGTEQTDGTAVLDIRPAGRLITASDILAFFRKSSIGKTTHAKNPCFDDERIRLDTFQDKWRNDFKMDASDTKYLANAGFYYTGPRDVARCFFCNGGIENWEEDDEPWSEHAKNFPNCEWLIDMKGKAFVDEVQAAKAAEEAEERIKSKEISAVFSQSPVQKETSTSQSDIASKAVQIMESPTIKVIERTGCDQRLIRRMVEAQLRGPGLDLSSSDNFIRTLWAAEEQVDSPGKTSTTDTQINLFANMQISDGPEHILPPASASTPVHQQRMVPGAKQCLMCKSNDTSTQFLPCSHEVACLQCSRVALTCPQCATPIKTCRRISEIL